MSYPLRPGTAVTPGQLRTAQERYRLLQTELVRLRTTATAWRNGLVGMLAALTGFSLLRGRSDVNELYRPWDIVVGIMLLAALLAGGYAAICLLRAVAGRPAVSAVGRLLTGLTGQHAEVIAATRALNRGMGWALGCAGLLVVAVGITWYGPGSPGPTVQVVTPTTTNCGSIMHVVDGLLTLTTDTGSVTIKLNHVLAVVPLATCAGHSAP